MFFNQKCAELVPNQTLWINLPLHHKYCYDWLIGLVVLISLSSIFVCLQLLIKGRLGLGDEEDYAVPQRVRNKFNRLNLIIPLIISLQLI